GVPELLRAARRVADVHLDQWRLELRAGVEQRVGVVRPRGRVEHDRRAGVRRRVEPVEHLALVVGLPHLDVEPEVTPPLLAQADQVFVRRAAVDLRLPPAEPPEVRPVEHQHPRHRHPVHRTSLAISAYAAVSSAGSGAVRIEGRASPSSTTKRSWSPRVFLSTFMPSCSCAQLAPRYDVGSPTSSSTVRCRSAVASSSRPASRASSATKVIPIATAAPCRKL